MCAIIDANVLHEAFGDRRTEAGTEFRRWIDRGASRLVIGGKQLAELDENRTFQEWRAKAAQFGRVQHLAEGAVRARTSALQASHVCRSNDHHVIALAQLSGARLLYSNDVALHHDFKNRLLIDSPKGRVYSTRRGPSFRRSHRELLRDGGCGS